MEYVRVLNKKKETIGKCLKDEVHHKGLWHEVFGCLLVDKDKNKVYLQYKSNKHNDLSKKDKVDISVGGHLLYDEDIRDGIREIKEEASIDVNYDDLEYVGERVIDVFINDDYIIREFIYLHILFGNFDLNKLKSIDDEVLYFIEFDLDDLIDFVSSSKRESIIGITHLGKREFKKDDFIKAYLEEDHYYYNYLRLAKERIVGNNIFWEDITN